MNTAQNAVCYVCGLSISSPSDAYPTSEVDGRGAWRHSRSCAPGTEQWARKHPDSLLGMLYRQAEPNPPSQPIRNRSFNEFLDCRYWPVAKAKVSEEWAIYTERFIFPTIRETVPEVEMSAWNEEHLEQWWAGVQTRCTPARANKVLTRFRHMMKTAKRWKVIADDPSVHLRKAKEAEREYPALSEHNQARLLAGCRKALRQYILFALYTGARRSSLARLEHRDIDLGQGEILFRKTKNGKDYRVPIHPALWDVLGRLLACPVDSRNKETTCSSCRKAGLTHCRHVLHQFVDLNSISKSFARLARRIGIPGFRFHDLRHCVGSRLADGGANQKVIMEVLGHKTNVMSLRYTHVQREAVRGAMEEYL